MDAPTTAVPPATKAQRRPRRLWRWTFVTLIFVLFAVLITLWFQPAPPRFELITADGYERRTKPIALVQDARTWLTRVRPKTFGFAPVQISASYVMTERGNASEGLAHLSPPQYSSNAVRVWILGSNDVARAEKSLRSTNHSRWRVSTADGISSILSTGPAGSRSLKFATHPKIRRGNVDLAAKVSSFSTTNRAGGVAQRVNHETTFRLLLKSNEGGIIVDNSGVLFIWAHAP
jgi:hypothetical protein